MHMRLAARVGAPSEGAVGKGDLQPEAVKDLRPKQGHLFALGDRIGRDKGDAGGCCGPPTPALPHEGGGRCGGDVSASLEKPRTDEIQCAAGFAEVGNLADLFALLHGLEFCANERRVAQHVTAPLCWQHVGPVQVQRVAVHDVGGFLQGYPGVIAAERLGQRQVHQVVHHPHCGFGNAGGKFGNLDPVELIDIDAGQGGGIKAALAGGVQLPQKVKLQHPQLAVGDDQEIAAATGGIKEGEPGQLVVERGKPGGAVGFQRTQAGKFGAQVIKEQGADQFEDVLLGGVMRALFATLVRVHHRLKKAAEDRGGNRCPVKAAGVEEGGAHVGVERRSGEIRLKQPAVDVGEGGKIGVQRALTLILGRVQHVEQLRQFRAKIGAIGGGAAIKIGHQPVTQAEDAGVIGEQAKHDAGQKHL